MNLTVLEYVEAARLRGEGTWWIIRREILPNASAPLLSEFGLRFCFNFLFIAALSFLGLGIQPPFADWGGMVRENSAAINFGMLAPIYPAATIALTVRSTWSTGCCQKRVRRAPGTVSAPRANKNHHILTSRVCVWRPGAVQCDRRQRRRHAACRQVLGLIGESGAGKHQLPLWPRRLQTRWGDPTTASISASGCGRAPRGRRIAYVAQSASAA
jgi:hypothetical protein